MSYFNSLYFAISKEIVRAISGKLLTEDQIKTVTTHTVGKYFSDFFPETISDRTIKERVDDARLHIEKANKIILSMQEEINNQINQLDKIATEVEENKKMSEKYKELVSVNKEQFSAFRHEMEDTLRQELVSQSNKGKGIRLTLKFVFWCSTLILGAALSTYFKQVLNWAYSILGYT